MDWKQTRAAIPWAGLSVLSREKVISAGHINLLKEHPARHVACELISRYEQRLHLQGFDHFELKKIKFHSGTGRLSKMIPLAPVPQESGTLKDSGEVCSMGVLMKKGLLGQVWFILRVRYAGNVLHFNLEATERDNAGGFAMNIAANTLLLPLNLMGSSSNSEPTVAFGKQSEKRLEWARTQSSPITEALTEAVASIDDEIDDLKSQASALRAQQRSHSNPGSSAPPPPSSQQSPVTPPPIAPTSEKKKRW